MDKIEDCTKATPARHKLCQADAEDVKLLWKGKVITSSAAGLRGLLFRQWSNLGN